MRYGSVALFLPTRPVTAYDIFPLRHWLKVGWVDTAPDATLMVKNHARGNYTTRRQKHKTVNTPHFSVNASNPIAMIVERPKPHPTSAMGYCHQSASNLPRVTGLHIRAPRLDLLRRKTQGVHDGFLSQPRSFITASM